MTDILKGKIIVKAIKAYKNREEWTDIYVEQNYAEAIEYMFKNFDKYFSDSSSGSGSGINLYKTYSDEQFIILWRVQSPHISLYCP